MRRSVERSGLIGSVLVTIAVGAAHAQSDRHNWVLQADLDSAAPSSPLDFGASRAMGRLRYDDGYDGIGLERLLQMRLSIRL